MKPQRRWFCRVVLVPMLMVSAAGGHAGPREDFFKAVELDNVHMMRALLANGFDPNTFDDNGQAALFLAMQYGSLAVAELLLAHKSIEVDRVNALGETPVMMAALHGHGDWVARLLARGAALNRSGWTPLHYAASGPEPKVLALLLERGAVLEAAPANGTTALMMAAGYGAIDGAELLLARGANAGTRNAAGLNAADFARRAGRDALVRRLEQAVR